MCGWFDVSFMVCVKVLGGGVHVRERLCHSVLCMCVFVPTENGHDTFDPMATLRGSPLPHHLSKRDISLPTRTSGPLFTSVSDELEEDESEDEDERPSSVPPVATQRPLSVQDEARARVSLMHAWCV